MSLNLQEIWKLQRELNIIIGRDTVGDPEKEKWFVDYTIALHDEATELFNCFSWKWWSLEYKEQGPYKLIDPENAKIEAIDCLHFLISLMQIKDFDLIKLENKFDEYWDYMTNIKPTLWKISKLLINDSVELSYNKSKKVTERILHKTMSDLVTIFVILGFEKGDILKIYKMKHEKNILRQKNGYSVINKTEDDNNEIKAKIKN